jgi:acetyltransferase-like isoleucine patch superfamily enzyme
MKFNKLIKKVSIYFLGKIIKQTIFINDYWYRDLYTNYLRRLGVKIEGTPNFISGDARFDSSDYSLIEIGNNSTISTNVLLLTHDASPYCAYHAINREMNYNGFPKLGKIHIGNNSFIGANCTILQDTYIGDHTIVGAGSVVKGKFPDGVIIMGNPAKIVANTVDWINKKIETSEDYKKFIK